MSSAFPILALVVRTGEITVYHSPTEIPSGTAIKVLKTTSNDPQWMESYLRDKEQR